jgi:SAM-dependent methyltransferase
VRRPFWLGPLRRVTPISPNFGFERGIPVDRHYIAEFFDRHGPSIHGRVLEVGEKLYVRERGAFSARQRHEPPPPVRSSVTSVDILDVSESNPEATIVADLGDRDAQMPADSFDCIICTQTLQFVYDLDAAVNNLHSALKPGGSLLITVPGISQVSAPEVIVSPRLSAADYGGEEELRDYWRLTPASAAALCAESFGREGVVVESYGNVLTAVALLHGLTIEDLGARELAHNDAGYPVIVGICATKAPGQ